LITRSDDADQSRTLHDIHTETWNKLAVIVVVDALMMNAEKDLGTVVLAVAKYWMKPANSIQEVRLSA
jgi:hypothetical protein